MSGVQRGARRPSLTIRSAAPTAESAKSFKVPDGAPAVRIMKRPQTPDSARPPDPKPKPPAPQKSLQEREEEYRKARERIFGLDPQSKAREPPTK